MKLYLIAICAIFAVTVSFADCPSKAPKIKKGFLSDGDQKVTAAWLQKNLSGRKVVYQGNEVETYLANGSYSYRAGGQSYDAATYKFYENGMRCIGYSTPRFDLYVVNNGKLVLVNAQKQRFVGQIRK